MADKIWSKSYDLIGEAIYNRFQTLKKMLVIELVQHFYVNLQNALKMLLCTV